jgi:hypothetical protein
MNAMAEAALLQLHGTDAGSEELPVAAAASAALLQLGCTGSRQTGVLGTTVSTMQLVLHWQSFCNAPSRTARHALVVRCTEMDSTDDSSPIKFND